MERLPIYDNEPDATDRWANEGGHLLDQDTTPESDDKEVDQPEDTAPQQN